MELNREPINFSADEKRKYLFLKQIHTLEAFRERNAISKEQYDISYNGLISKMEIKKKKFSSFSGYFILNLNISNGLLLS